MTDKPDQPDSWRWEHFSPDEMRCKHCGALGMVPEFMDKLERIRQIVDAPLVVSSGFRCPDHNAQVSGTGRDGPHTTGRAVDLICSGTLAYAVLAAALLAGMKGIGIKQTGQPQTRFIHLDDLREPFPRPTVWSY